jgi:hypothetical protein
MSTYVAYVLAEWLLRGGILAIVCVYAVENAKQRNYTIA